MLTTILLVIIVLDADRRYSFLALQPLLGLWSIRHFGHRSGCPGRRAVDARRHLNDRVNYLAFPVRAIW